MLTCAANCGSGSLMTSIFGQPHEKLVNLPPEDIFFQVQAAHQEIQELQHEDAPDRLKLQQGGTKTIPHELHRGVRGKSRSVDVSVAFLQCRVSLGFRV